MANTICVLLPDAAILEQLMRSTEQVPFPVADWEVVKPGDRILIAAGTLGSSPQYGTSGWTSGWTRFDWLLLGKVFEAKPGQVRFHIGQVYRAVSGADLAPPTVDAMWRSALDNGKPKIISGRAKVRSPMPISKKREGQVLGEIHRAAEWEREHGPLLRKTRIRWRLGKSPSSTGK